MKTTTKQQQSLNITRYTVDPTIMLLPSEKNPFKCHEEVLYCSLYDPTYTKCFDIFPPDWGMLRRRSTCIQIFLQKQILGKSDTSKYEALNFVVGDVDFLKKNQNAPRPSEHPPVMGKKVKTFRWDQRLQIQNLFMAFKQVPRCR